MMSNKSARKFNNLRGKKVATETWLNERRVKILGQNWQKK
jgi:hypothetical protein